MGQVKRTKGLAVLFALGLAVSACGSDSSGDAKTDTGATLVDKEVAGAAESLLGNTSTTASTGGAQEDIKTIADWEALWDAQRADLVAEAEKNGWKWDQATKTVSGPGGFSVDLSKCPAGWDPYGGLGEGKITIGQPIAQSGTVADYGNIGLAQGILYDYINSQGGIKDSEGKTYTIENTLKDDAYDAAKTVPLVDEFLDSEGSFAIQTLGSPNTMKVYDKINSRCVPQPYSMTGHPAWGDPVNHPWVWGNQMAYNTEAILWGGLLEKKFADKPEITVAGLIMQNDFGKAYELGFNEFIKTSKIKINFVFERIEPTAPTITNQMTTLASKNPDVFIAMTAGTSCTQAITEAANNGMKDTVQMLFMPSVCKGLNFVGKEKVGDDGTASNAWWVVGGGGLDFNDPANADNVWVAWARDLLSNAGHPSEDSSQLGNGFFHGWPVVQSLKLAAELPGGMSRPNFMLAARMLNMTNPNLLPGINYNMAGNDDPYPVEGSEFAVFDGSKQTWVVQEDLGLIDLSGKSSPCAWDQTAAACK